MVVFTCNACSAVLKRNQVDKHCQQCRRCESLSCVDCGKDFWGDDYQKHLKCITEEEKYGGKDVAPKMFKGEAKQEQWVEQVQSAIEQASSKPKLKWLLERLRDYPNIPRKKTKFENFLKNSLRILSTALISEVWDVLMTGNNKTQNGNKEGLNNQQSQTQSESNGHATKAETSNDQQEDETVESNVPKSKRDKKEERRQKAHKKEKKDKSLETEETTAVEVKAKKSKKRKRHESEEDQGVENGDDKEKENIKKKKKKKKDTCDETVTTEDDNTNNDSRFESTEDVEEAPPSKKKKMKFNWETVIKAVLEKKGEMTLKKLKKKVLSEFAAQDAANYNEDNLSAKFDKKILRTEGVKVSKERASLKEK